jgi:hypothetical protein
MCMYIYIYVCIFIYMYKDAYASYIYKCVYSHNGSIYIYRSREGKSNRFDNDDRSLDRFSRNNGGDRGRDNDRYIY